MTYDERKILKMNGESVRIWQEAVAVDWRADIGYCSSTRLEKLREATKIPSLEPVPSSNYRYNSARIKGGMFSRSLGTARIGLTFHHISHL